MSTPKALRLLIIDDSQNDAEAYNKAILTTGQTTRHVYLKNKDDLEQQLRTQPDIILLAYKNKFVSLDELKKAIASQKLDCSIILLCAADTEITPAKALQSGAADRILKRDLDHLKYAVAREFANVKFHKSAVSLQQLYQDSEKRCQDLIENTRDAIAYVHEGMHVYANKSYLEMFGLESFDDIEGLPVMDLVANKEQSKFKNFLRNVSDAEIVTDAIQSLSVTLKQADESEFEGTMEFGVARVDGETCTEITIRQSGDTKELEEQISQLSKLDALSGLLNRQSFIADFESKIEKSLKKGKSFSLLSIGIDNFEAIQDKAGLTAADQIIKDVANVIKKSISKNDVAGRYEGSHYFVITDASDEDKLTLNTQKILTAIEEHSSTIDGRIFNPISSAGICIIDDDSIDINESISRAMKAMEQAQEDGGNTLELYRPKEGEMTQKQLDAAWTKRIDTALKENRFRLLYQPIVQLDDQSIERYEVFVEMQDDKGERVPPGEFLPAAERTQMSKAIDRWVITNALKQLVEQLKAKHLTHFFIKLTGGSLEDTQLFRWISDEIKKYTLPKNSIVFEVKESAVVSHLKQAQAFATLLKTIHCHFAIDDFGRGQDPFKLLEHIPAQYLKFTKDFSMDLAGNQQNQETLREICEKAKEMNKFTIVQRVEDAAALTVLYAIGTDYMQGHFFQGPSDKLEYNFSSGLDTMV